MKGFGHVDFESAEAAQNAVAKNGCELEGRALKVDLSEAKQGGFGGGRGGFGGSRGAAWWLGPEGNPQFPLVWFTPFVVIVVALVATQRPRKFTIAIHLVCVALLTAIASGDVVDSPGVAALQYGIAAIALLVSFVSLAARP